MLTVHTRQAQSMGAERARMGSRGGAGVLSIPSALL